MGKQSWQKGGGDHSGGKWHVWPGAWASSPQQQPKAPWRQQGRTHHFPAYDDKSIRPAPGRHNNPQTAADQDQQDNGLGGIQKLVNTARKAEQRLTRLQSDKETSILQWQQYQKDLQAAFNRERKRHYAAQEQFEKDIASAVERQDEARANIRQYAASMATGMPVETDGDNGPTWEEMTRAWVEEEDGAIEGVLHRALGPATREIEPRTPSLRRPVAARTPLTSRATSFSREGPSPAPSYATEELAAARSDPYPVVTSPSPPKGPPTEAPPSMDVPMEHGLPSGEGHRAEAKASPSHPGQRDLSAPRVPTTEAPPRMDVKSATKSSAPSLPVHSQLGQKLEAKRSAMQPFGGKALPTAHPGVLQDTSTGDPPALRPPRSILDDDHEELEEMVPSPGFGNLE